MAGQGYKLFLDDEVLYANDVNGYLMDQAVMVFATPTERNSNIITPSEGMLAYTKSDDTLRYYNGSSWLPAAITSVTAGSGISGGGSGTSSVTIRLNVDNKGDILVGTGNDTVSIVQLGSNNQLLVVDTNVATGVKWSSTLSGLTLLSPTISSIQVFGGTVTLPTGTDTLVGRATTDTLTNKTLTSPVVNTPAVTGGTITSTAIARSILTTPIEQWNIQAAAATGTINLDLLSSTSSIVYYTAFSTGNVTFNVRGNVATALTTLIPVGQAVSVALIMTNGPTAYYPSQFRIDNTVITPLWQGAVPIAGNANSTDIWLYTLVNTATGWKVFASGTRFL